MSASACSQDVDDFENVLTPDRSTGIISGFTLKEIAELLALRADSKSTCAKVKKQAEAKISHIEEKIRLLKRMKAALGRLASSCKAREPQHGCPILEYLNKQGNWE